MEFSSLFYYIGCLPVSRFHMLIHMSNLCVVGWNEINSKLQLHLSPGDQNLNRYFIGHNGNLIYLSLKYIFQNMEFVKWTWLKKEAFEKRWGFSSTSPALQHRVTPGSGTYADYNGNGASWNCAKSWAWLGSFFPASHLLLCWDEEEKESMEN